MSAQATAETNSALGIIPSAAWRLTSVAVLPSHRLALIFRDGLKGIADLSELVRRPDAGIFTPLIDETLFAQVFLDLGVPTWPNGADLDPCWLHDEARLGRVWRG